MVEGLGLDEDGIGPIGGGAGTGGEKQQGKCGQETRIESMRTVNVNMVAK